MKCENEQNSFLHNMISDVYLHASGSELGSQLVRGRGKLLTNRTGEGGGRGGGMEVTWALGWSLSQYPPPYFREV